MSTRNRRNLITEMNGAVKGLRTAGPALDHATQGLIALAKSFATRCAPCIADHAEGAIKTGATREEVAETLAMAVYMGAGPSVMYAANALEAVDQLATAP